MSAASAPDAFVRSADGTRIAYRKLGTGPALVVVHGGLGTSTGWTSAARALAARFEVFLFDRRGRGQSADGAGPHALEREVEDLEALLRLAGPGASLLGHSFGGAVALEAARRAVPGQLAAIAVYEPAVGIGGSIAPAEIDQIEALIADDEPGAAIDLALTRIDAAGLMSADPRAEGERRPEGVLALAPTVPRELRAVTAPGLDLNRYAGLDVPVLVLVGTRSPEPQRRNCERLAAALRDARLARLENVGHVAHTAAPDRLAATVVAFLAGADG